LPQGVIVVLRDLREVVELRRQVITAGRLAAVGQLAAGIAHEINNPMAYVGSNLSQLQESWQRLSKWLPARGIDPELDSALADGYELIADSLEGVARTSAIVRDVRSFAHRGTGENESVDLNEILEDVVRIALPQLRDRIRVELRLGDVSRIQGAPQELRQLFLNLVVNAFQAIEGEGTLRLSTIQDERWVTACVSDDGCGIDAADRERIFDPFFTTKPVGEGTGLGLAICHQIVRSHGAELGLESRPGGGTTVTVRFTRTPDA
jgi:signal transduction histidine kinase